MVWAHYSFIWPCQDHHAGTVNGGRRRGRQKKRWDDNIREWTGFELRNTLRKAKIERNGKLWLGDPLLRPDGSQI
ncbi:hypothetical protein PoB_000139700 [Plakobranchus ocellatus]|uniref:Uncharacterized protein n=1 Tax=Plakobranchus ocellatus TaxID=259542 RepID=A0AAV3XXN8_9GAST|nr:hypothetical protein PoB_000139700 [Plakobranchus ocellatus]